MPDNTGVLLGLMRIRKQQMAGVRRQLGDVSLQL